MIHSGRVRQVSSIAMPKPPVPTDIFLGGSRSVTSTLISQLAVGALKRRLADQTNVQCDVNASPGGLLSGRVGPVTVKGRAWRSPLGLTCRAIEAKVENCALDLGKVVQMQKLRLTVPARGDAMIALNSGDFLSFMTHPLLTPPLHHYNGRHHAIEFVKEGVSIDSSRENGSVEFYANFLQHQWRCLLKRQPKGNGAIVEVVLHKGKISADERTNLESELTEVLTDFFNNIVFELDGTFLSFRDMMVTSRGKEPCVMLSLKIVVKKFPSSGIAF